MRTLTGGLAGLLLFGVAGTGLAQPMRATEGTAQATPSVADQLRQLQAELKPLREELAELKGTRGEPTPVGPGAMPMGPGMMSRPMEPMSPQIMQPMMQMMQACGQMMAQMGGMGAMTPRPETQSRQGNEPTEHGTQQVGGLEVTLLSASPLSPAEMQRMMLGMGGQGAMPGMGGMMGGMRGMEGPGGAETRPTHWVGVVVRDVKDDRTVQGLHITLTAQKDKLSRTVILMPMPGSYGANISLPEKGRYTVRVGIAGPRQPLSVPFDFEYK